MQTSSHRIAWCRRVLRTRSPLALSSAELGSGRIEGRSSSRVLDRAGFTLLEVLTAMFVMALLIVCTVSMLIAALRSCDSDLAQVNTDTTAVTAMQTMVTDVREAKQVEPLDSGSRLRITFPMNPTGQKYYDRTDPHAGHQVSYYLSDGTGIVGRSGTDLWQSAYGRLRCVCTNVDYLYFEYADDEQKAVKITIRTKDRTYDPLSKANDPIKTKYCVQTELTERVVYLRNYAR